MLCFRYIIVNTLRNGDNKDDDDDYDDDDDNNNNNNNNATMYPLGTWFVPGICVWLPCIKKTMM